MSRILHELSVRGAVAFVKEGDREHWRAEPRHPEGHVEELGRRCGRGRAALRAGRDLGPLQVVQGYQNVGSLTQLGAGRKMGRGPMLELERQLEQLLPGKKEARE